MTACTSTGHHAWYEIEGRIVDAMDRDAIDTLAEAHRRRLRPRCLCRPGGAPMYVARLGDGFIVKRMPNTGDLHAPGCTSQVTAVRTHTDNGSQHLFVPPADSCGADTIGLAFPLTSAIGESHAQGSRHTHADIACKVLSLSALLRLLWHRAGLDEWHPAFAGKRNWAVVRWRLLRAAEGLMLRSGEPLADRLYIPEVFSVEERAAIDQRREALWAGFTNQAQGRRRLLIIAELKDVMPSPTGNTIRLKQLPDLGFRVTDPGFAAGDFRSNAGSRARPTLHSPHTVVIGTLIITSPATATFHSLTLQHLNSDWLPKSANPGGTVSPRQYMRHSSHDQLPVATLQPRVV